MRIFLALLFLAAPCMGANFAKVGEIYKGKLGTDDVEVGAIVSNKIKPQLKLYKWDGEDSLTVNFPSMGSINKTAATCNGSTVTFKCSAGNVMVYVTPEGYLEYEGLFKSVPWSSVQLTLTGWEAFDFFYQPPLTPEEIAMGAIRPDNVVGSYAIYHKAKANNKYQTGKAFHIFRPCWIAADGQRLWIDQTIVNGVWNLSWDKAWTDAAAKPLTLDPTLGWSAIGGSTAYWNAAFAYSSTISTLTPTGVNKLNSIYMYGKNSSRISGEYHYYYLYGDNGGYPGTKLTINNSTATMPTTDSWFTSDGDMDYELPISTRVHIVMAVSGTNTFDFYYDTGISGSNMTYSSDKVFDSPFTKTGAIDGWRVSIYLSYTESGTPAPAPSVPFLPQVLIWEN